MCPLIQQHTAKSAKFGYWSRKRGCDICPFWKKEDDIIHLILMKNGFAALSFLNKVYISIKPMDIKGIVQPFE
jgi:hypothetical protein